MQAWRRLTLTASLLATLLLTSPGCEIFLADNWGWEGYPCDADRHCQAGLTCFWAVGNPACAPESTWKKFECPADLSCSTQLDGRFDCDTIEEPNACVTNDEVVWCFDNGSPSDAICKAQDQAWRCLDGICIQD